MDEGTLGKKAAGLVQLSRPFTLIAPSCGVLAGGIIALASHGELSVLGSLESILWPLFAASLLYAVINSASNAFNQVYDLDIDAVNKPSRPIPSGTISIKGALAFSIVLYCASIAVAALVSTYFLLFTALFIAITILYSIPPFRLKKRLWVSNLSIAVARSWLLFLAGWSIYPFTNPLEPTIWFVGLVLFVFLLGSSATKDFTDLEGDRLHDMRTLPVVYGTKRAIDIIAPFFIAPFLLIPAGVILGYLPVASVYLVPFAVWGTYIAIRFKDSAQKNTFENSPVWVHMYLMLITLQLGFGTVFVI